MEHILIYYNAIKILHVISASILFGTGLGTALYMLIAHYQQNLQLRAKAYAQVVFSDWCFTTPSAIFQALSGFIMIYMRGYYLQQTDYQWHALWVQGSVLGYVIAGACWIPVLFLQNNMQKIVHQAAVQNQPLPKRYHNYFRAWFLLGIPAFLSLIIVFYLMTNRPLHF